MPQFLYLLYPQGRDLEEGFFKFTQVTYMEIACILEGGNGGNTLSGGLPGLGGAGGAGGIVFGSGKSPPFLIPQCRCKTEMAPVSVGVNLYPLA